MQAILDHNNILQHRQTYIRDIENEREAGRSREEVEAKPSLEVGKNRERQ